MKKNRTKIESGGGVLHTIREREPEVEPQIESEPVSEPEPKVEPVPVASEKAPVKLVRITPFESFILIQDHDICTKEGVCTCSLINGKRSPKTVHIIAGIPVVIPATMLDNKVLQDKRKRGKVILKRL